MFKRLAAIILIVTSIEANAETLSCNFVSGKGETEQNFLSHFAAEFNCGGSLTQFVGDNIYVSCKPQFVLAKFAAKLSVGEKVTFEIADQRVSSIDGSSRIVAMVRSAVSASGKVLKPQTIIQHGKPVKCDPTQIVVQ